ncbi:hypothetical protein BC567DRAFT_219215 [Phyllosticta citribraziliensis]
MGEVTQVEDEPEEDWSAVARWNKKSDWVQIGRERRRSRRNGGGGARDRVILSSCGSRNCAQAPSTHDPNRKHTIRAIGGRVWGARVCPAHGLDWANGREIANPTGQEGRVDVSPAAKFATDWPLGVSQVFLQGSTHHPSGPWRCATVGQHDMTAVSRVAR